MTFAAWPGTLSKLARPAALTMGTFLAVGFVLDMIVVLTLPTAVPSFDATLLSSLASGLAEFPLAVVALVLALRRPRNPAGWLLGSLLALGLLSGLGSDYLFHWLYGHDLPQALVTPFALASASAGPTTFFGLTTLLLFFPNGHLLSPRWRGFVWLNLFMACLAVVTPLLDPNSLGDGHRQLPNPLGLAGAHPILSVMNTLVGLAIFALAFVGLVSLGIRYRRSDLDGRQQIKWFGVGVGVLFAAVTVGLITSPTSNWTTPIPIGAEIIGFSALPLCIGVAVLKYRLYDLDILINRALIYGSLAVFITAVYVGIAVGIGTLVGSGGKPNLVLSIVATAIVALGFQPFRERVQKVANRLVYGARATPYEVLAQFSERVAESYAGDEVLARMARVLAEGTAAEVAEVWLGKEGEMRRAAAFPGETAMPAGGQLIGKHESSITKADRSVLVHQQGDVLGALTVTKRRGETLTPIEIKLMDDLAHQAGLVLKNVGLTADLQARLLELRASRQRLVSAQDDERRKLERNLHDGAQQYLVAIKVKLGLVEMLMSKDIEKARATLVGLKTEADEALETLRDLARGIYPPLLADRGLVVALQSQANKATVPVTIEDLGVQRYAPDIEATVYFCVLEALQNIQKYAKATKVNVELQPQNDFLQYAVQDDGEGFDPASVSKGAGLTNMSDRLEALGGSLRLQSEKGRGTTIIGLVPIRHLGVAS